MNEPTSTPPDTAGAERDQLPKEASGTTPDAASLGAPGTDGMSQNTDGMSQTSSQASWGAAARGVTLFALLSMSTISWMRLSWGKDWIGDFLSKNTLDMPVRDVFLIQLLLAAFVGGAVALLFLFLRRKRGDGPALLGRWGWFTSPLILLPAIPIIKEHEAWVGKHHDLVPIVLFLGLLVERFGFQALKNVPAIIRESLSDLVAPIYADTQTGRFLRKYGWLLLVVTAALAYGAFMSFYTVRWHQKLGTATFDLGINNNLIFGGLHGKINQSPIIFPEDPQKYIANHFKLGLYYFLPIYALFPRPETLLVIQSVSLGLGAIPLFLFARRHIQPWQATILALSYLCYYPMHGANFYEMKLVPTAAAMVLTLIWALDARHWKTVWVFFVLTLFMREDMPVPLATIGIFLLLTGYRPRSGALIALVSILWFAFVRFKLMMDYGSWWFPNMYEDLWSKPETGFRSVLKTLLSNPTYVLKHIFVEKKFWYLLHMLTPLLFLPLRRWYLWAALVPGAILTLLVTNYDPPILFSFQYVMHFAPYLFVAAAIALSDMRRTEGNARTSGAIVGVGIASLALTFNYGAFPARDRALEAGFHKITFSFSDEERKTYEDVKRLVASIPEEASVASTERVGAHLSSRIGMYTLRRGHHNVDYIVARKKGLRLDRTKQSIKDALVSGDYGVVGHYGEFYVLKRGADTKGNDDLIASWKLAPKPKPKKKKSKSRGTSGDGGSSHDADAPESDEEEGPERDEYSPSEEPKVAPKKPSETPLKTAPKDEQAKPPQAEEKK